MQTVQDHITSLIVTDGKLDRAKIIEQMADTLEIAVTSRPPLGAHQAGVDISRNLIVLIDAILAFEPQAAPPYVLDREGDLWTREDDGRYTWGSLASTGTLDELEAEYGPLTPLYIRSA